MNYSRQRELILDILKQSRAHPTAEELFALVQERMPTVARGTVYRNLGRLADSGEIIRFATPTGTYRFDYPHFSHSHAVCTVCGAVVDIPLLTEAVEGVVQTDYGFTVRGGMLVFGQCKNCTHN